MRRAIALSLLALGACSSPDPETEARIEDFGARARAYYDSGDLARAEQQARLGLALDPEHGLLNLLLGRTLLRWQDPQHLASARPFLEKAHEELHNHRSGYSLGEYHLRYAELLLQAAAARRQRAEDLPDTPEDAGAVARLEARAADQRQRAAAHLAQARELLEWTVAQEPGDPYALRLMASCYTHLERPDDALRTLEHLVSVLARSRQFKNERLAMLDLPLVQETALREELKRDIRMEVEARGLIAAVLKQRKDYRAAEAQLTEILKLDPDLPREHYNRGLCRYWLGDAAGAAEDMQKFLRTTDLPYESEEVSRALDVVAEFRARTAGAAAAAAEKGPEGAPRP